MVSPGGCLFRFCPRFYLTPGFSRAGSTTPATTALWKVPPQICVTMALPALSSSLVPWELILWIVVKLLSITYTRMCVCTRVWELDHGTVGDF